MTSEKVCMLQMISVCKLHSTYAESCSLGGGDLLFQETEEITAVTLEHHLLHLTCTADKNAYERNKEAAHNENRCVFLCMNTDKICIFTDKGKMHTIKAVDIPLVRFRDKGTPVDNLSNYDSSQEQMLYVAPLGQIKQDQILFVTKTSMCKLVDGAEFDVTKSCLLYTSPSPRDTR